MRERGRNADHKLLAAEQGHVMDTVSLDFAFFGEPGQTAKLVLILREHKCRWTEAPFVQSKGGQDLWVAQAVADMVRRTRLQRLMFKFDQVPSILGLKSKVVAELGGSKDVSMEASLVNGHQSNGFVERADQTVGGRKLALEQPYSKEWEDGHVVVQRLVMHAASRSSGVEREWNTMKKQQAVETAAATGEVLELEEQCNF